MLPSELKNRVLIDSYLDRILLKIFCAHLMRKFMIIYRKKPVICIFYRGFLKIYVFNLTFDMMKYLYNYYYIIYNLYIILLLQQIFERYFY